MLPHSRPREVSWRRRSGCRDAGRPSSWEAAWQRSGSARPCADSGHDGPILHRSAPSRSAPTTARRCPRSSSPASSSPTPSTCVLRRVRGQRGRARARQERGGPRCAQRTVTLAEASGCDSSDPDRNGSATASPAGARRPWERPHATDFGGTQPCGTRSSRRPIAIVGAGFIGLEVAHRAPARRGGNPDRGGSGRRWPACSARCWGMVPPASIGTRASSPEASARIERVVGNVA